ncbi:Transposase [Phytophthora megakarya]|uniref:Transposase n=1 Tax=Phytophthora megakarya TaxID=4795 RepID=A0A225V7V9_9STRA|nr:Transposase [Phytophthora megakarya]
MFVKLSAKIDQMDLSTTEQPVLKSAVESCFDFAYGDAHGVAYMLDPRFCGKSMDEDTTRNVEKFLVSCHGGDNESEVLVEISRFRAMVKDLRGTMRYDLLEKQRISILDFWCGLDGYPLLQYVAGRVFASGCPSAASERNFSTHQFIHSSLRSRTKPTRVEKLFHHFFNAHNVDADEFAFLDEFVQDQEAEKPDCSNQHDDYVYYLLVRHSCRVSPSE